MHGCSSPGFRRAQGVVPSVNYQVPAGREKGRGRTVRWSVGCVSGRKQWRVQPRRFSDGPVGCGLLGLPKARHRPPISSNVESLFCHDQAATRHTHDPPISPDHSFDGSGRSAVRSASLLILPKVVCALDSVPDAARTVP